MVVDIYRQRFESCRVFVGIRAHKSFLGTRGFHRVLCAPMRRVLLHFSVRQPRHFGLQLSLRLWRSSLAPHFTSRYQRFSLISFACDQNGTVKMRAGPSCSTVHTPDPRLCERLFGDVFWSLCPRCKTTQNLGHTETRRTIKRPSATSHGQTCLAYLGSCWQPSQSLGIWRTWLCSLQSIKWKL